jgi:hypothetical protein
VQEWASSFAASAIAQQKKKMAFSASTTIMMIGWMAQSEFHEAGNREKRVNIENADTNIV